MGTYITWNDPPSFIHFDVTLSESHKKGATVTEHPVEQGADITDHIQPHTNEIEISTWVSQTPLKNVNRGQSPSNLTRSLINVPVTLTVDGQKLVRKTYPLTVTSQPFQPSLLTLERAVSNAVTSLLAPGTLSAQGSTIQSTQKDVTVNVLSIDNAEDYVAQTWRALDQLRVTGTLVSVVCPNVKYDNMVIADLDMSRDKGTGIDATFKILFKEIRIAHTLNVYVPTPARPKHQAPKKQAEQSAKPPATPADDSAFKGLVDRYAPQVKSFLKKLTGQG